MRFLFSSAQLLLLGGLSLFAAASSWGFEDATLSIQGKKSGGGGGLKEKCAFSMPMKLFCTPTDNCLGIKDIRKKGLEEAHLYRRLRNP